MMQRNASHVLETVISLVPGLLQSEDDEIHEFESLEDLFLKIVEVSTPLQYLTI